MLEKAIIDSLSAFVKIAGDLSDILVKNQAWAVVAVLFLLIMLQAFFARRDRLKKDDRIDQLLETRNMKILEAFDRATNVVQSMRDVGTRVGDLEDRIDAMDIRCDARQQARKGRGMNKGGHA